MQEAIDAYFKQCDENTVTKYNKEGNPYTVSFPIPYTIEGLCDVLEVDRLTLLNYEKQEGYEEFFNTVKKAKNKIQRNKLERGLMGESNSAVTIFDLKNNHNYVDSKNLDHTTKGESISISHDSIQTTKEDEESDEIG